MVYSYSINISIFALGDLYLDEFSSVTYGKRKNSLTKIEKKWAIKHGKPTPVG